MNTENGNTEIQASQLRQAGEPCLGTPRQSVGGVESGFARVGMTGQPSGVVRLASLLMQATFNQMLAKPA